MLKQIGELTIHEQYTDMFFGTHSYSRLVEHPKSRSFYRNPQCCWQKPRIPVDVLFNQPSDKGRLNDQSLPNGSKWKLYQEVRAWIIFGSSSCEVAGEEPCLYPAGRWNSILLVSQSGASWLVGSALMSHLKNSGRHGRDTNM